MDNFNPKSPLFWSKVVVQGVAMYNGFYHKNVDANAAIGVIAAVEVAYHAAHGLAATVQALLHPKPTAL